MAVKAGDMAIRIPIYLEFKGQGSSKFWEIGWVDETTFATMYGRIGCKGSQTKKSFASKWTAKEEFHKILKTKLNKGYRFAERPTSRMNFDLGLNDSGYLLVTQIKASLATVLNDDGRVENIPIHHLGAVMTEDNG